MGIVKEQFGSRARRDAARDTNPVASQNGCSGREGEALEKSCGERNESNQFSSQLPVVSCQFSRRATLGARRMRLKGGRLRISGDRIRVSSEAEKGVG
jgi:hypothetical protein